jgi:hypothetical protein
MRSTASPTAAREGQSRFWSWMCMWDAAGEEPGDAGDSPSPPLMLPSPMIYYCPLYHSFIHPSLCAGRLAHVRQQQLLGGRARAPRSAPRGRLPAATPIQLAHRAAATTRGATTRGRISRQPPLPIRGDASRSSWGPTAADVSKLGFRRGLAVEL